MEVAQINDILKNLDEYNLKAKYSQVSNETPKNYWQEKYEDENSVKTEVYRLGIDDWHLKVERTTDSYGNNETLQSVKFVKPIVKQVTDFE